MSVSMTEVKRVWKEADCLWSAQEVEQAITAQAAAISEQLADKNPLVLVVMRGAMFYASQLCMRLLFPMELDYIHLSRYGQGLSGSELKWRVRPTESIEGRHVLVLDDILDEGLTLEAIIQACEAQGAESVSTAVLVDKNHDRRPNPDFCANYIGLVAPDRYLFGYGMDYKGYLRNVNGIYAVKGL